MKNNKVAIVTGASSGIGKGIALYLLANQYKVILISRSKEKLEKIYKDYHHNCEILALDLTHHDVIKNELQKTLEKIGRLDLLINSAGYVKRGTSDLAFEEFIKMMETNLVSIFNIVSVISPLMKKQRSGRIVNIASHSGVVAKTQLGGYAASKFGVMGLNESLHKELAPFEVYVTAICPGLVATNMTKDVTSIDQSEFIQVDDIVKSLDYLLSLSPNVSIKEMVLQCRAKLLKTVND